MSQQDDMSWRKSESETSSPQFDSPRSGYSSQKTRSYNNSPYGGPRQHPQHRKPGYTNSQKDSRASYGPSDNYESLSYEERDSFSKKNNYNGFQNTRSDHGNHYNSPRKPHHENFQGPPKLQIPKNTWLFTSEEIEEHCPSVLDGMTLRETNINISKGVNFILQVAADLKLPHMVVYAAATFLHRFYLRCSLKKFHQYDMGATCLFLATKVEESTRKIRDIVISCVKTALKNPTLHITESSREFGRWKDLIVVNEELLLETLTFDLTLESPYTTLSSFADFLKIPDTSVRKGAWAFVNDSCRTPLSVMFPTKVIAAAAIHWALIINKVPPPDPAKLPDVGKDREPPSHWWEHPVIDVTKEDITNSCKIMMDHYEAQTNAAQAKPLSQTSTEKRKLPSDDASTRTPEKKPKIV